MHYLRIKWQQAEISTKAYFQFSADNELMLCGHKSTPYSD